MRLIIAGLGLLLATASAEAQVGSSGLSPNATGSMNIGQHAEAAAQKGEGSDSQKAKANDKAYDAVLKNLPDKQYDPWRGVR